MHFHWSGWLVLALFIYGIGWLIARYAVGVDCRIEAKLRGKNPRLALWAGTLGSFLIGVVVVNLLAYFAFSQQTDEVHQPWTTDVAAAFGLQSGVKYPLVLGARIGGSSVQADAETGFFSANASVSSRPASAISVSYTYGRKSYILELPTSQITFVQSQRAAPSVAIYLTDERYGGGQLKDHWGPCQLEIESLFTTCHRVLTSTTLHLHRNTRLAGLSPVVSSSLYSATLTLTPAMYDAVLGKTG